MGKAKSRRELKGGLGGGAGGPLLPQATEAESALQIDQRTPGKDLRLIGAAVRRGWLISDEMLKGIPVAMAQLVLRGEDERARVNAAKVLVEMYGQNNPPASKGSSVNVGVVVNHPGADLLD